MPIHENVRCEWGERGLAAICAGAVVVVVDVFSFGTATTLAVENGATVYAWGGNEKEAAAFAHREGAMLAADRSRTTFSLSPESLRALPAGARLVLPSQNGARLVAAARHVARDVAVASLRNASAVARWAATRGAPIALLPAGERWPDGSIRFALEDWIGAGAVIAALGGELSAEAHVAAAAFRDARPQLGHLLRDCVSGRELTSRGFAEDVRLAVDYDCTTVVPVAGSDGWLRAEDVSPCHP